MGLVSYSDSDSSDFEESRGTKHTAHVKRHSQPVFKKVVDKSNPGKIKVSLPQLSQTDDDEEHDEPPVKKARVNEGASIGFNSLLPAPKKGGLKGTTLGNKNMKKPTISGIKPTEETENGRYKGLHIKQEYTAEKLTEPVIAITDSNDVQPSERNNPEDKSMLKPLMFKPLCVSNRTSHKKKKITPESTSRTHLQAPHSTLPALESKNPPKISLFHMCSDVENLKQQSRGDYQPLSFMVDDKLDEVPDGAYDHEVELLHQDNTQTPKNNESLVSIAESLHLSSSERRRLFGRSIGKGEQNAEIRILNFSTDMEYLHNEKARPSGEQSVHNPVRAIAPGKHSLRQLVNAVQSQKDALEESFAKGKNNRAEASSRYGW